MKHTFFDDSEPMISVEGFYGRKDKICDVGIITFSEKALQWALENYEWEKAAEIGCANGARSIYTTTLNGKKVAFYMSLIGSAAAGSCIEDYAYLTGATKFIMFGSCGSLKPEETEGKIIIPASAYRDEGLSWHYLNSDDEFIDMPGWKLVAEFLGSRVPCITGKTWTTDAIFRETVNKAKRLRDFGCTAVEMECAGVQAVCQAKGFELYDFLFASDHLNEAEWNNRLLGTAEEYDMQIRCMKLAMEFAEWLLTAESVY